MSPAVCGLFRPTILIPASLAEHFSDDQLHTVILHELIHLRRQDVWVNFCQALLQIVYWWHPLVWFANARIRRVREEAVDDAVMLALAHRADSYAPTLLQVARLALHRPLVSLGLVGILESRHSLRHRIERLLDFHPPRRTGLTLLSLMGILAFTAVAVPMGEAPPEKPSFSAANLTAEKSPPPLRPEMTITAQFYLMPTGAVDSVLSKVPEFHEPGQPSGNSAGTFKPKVWAHLKNLLITAGYASFSSPKIKTLVGAEAEISTGDGTNQFDLKCSPYLQDSAVEMDLQGSLVKHSSGITSSNHFSAHVAVVDQGGFILQTKDDASSSNLVLAISIEIQTNELENISATSETAVHSIIFKCNQPITDAHFRRLLNQHGLQTLSTFLVNPANNLVVVRGTDLQLKTARNVILQLNGYPPNYSKIEVPPPSDDSALQSRAFKVGPYFLHNLMQIKDQTGLETDPTAPQTFWKETTIRAGLTKLGIRFAPTSKSSAFFDSDSSLLFAKVPASDMDTVENFVMLLNEPPLNAAEHASQVSNASPSGVLGDTNFQAVLHELEKRTGSETLNEPEVTTTSGRHNDVNRLNSVQTVSVSHPINWYWSDAGSIQVASNQPTSTNLADTQLITQVFKLDTNVVHDYIFQIDTNDFRIFRRGKTDEPPNDVVAAITKLTSLNGVDWSSPPGKSIFYKDTLGWLYVKATKSDLAHVEQTTRKLNSMPGPQLHIKARFIEVPSDLSDKLQPSLKMTNLFQGNPYGILTYTESRTLLQALETSPDTETLAEPEVTTTSSRQTQMRSTSIICVITNFTYTPQGTNGGIVPQSSNVEIGPAIDIIPYVLADLRTVQLQTSVSLVQFLGYENTTNRTPVETSTGEKVDVPAVNPKFTVLADRALANLWDNQTLVLEKKMMHSRVFSGKFDPLTSQNNPERDPKNLVLLVTATMVDAAGNRVHSEDDLPFAQKTIPVQPSPTEIDPAFLKRFNEQRNMLVPSTITARAVN